MVAAFYARKVEGFRYERSLVVLLVLAAFFLALSVPLVHWGLKPIYVILFCFNWVTFTIFTSHVITLSGKFFDTLAMKRLLPLFGVGATCGEIVGGLSSSFFARLLGAEGLLLVWLFFYLATASYLWSVRGRFEDWNPARSGASQCKRQPLPQDGWRYLKGSPLARTLALLTAALMVTNTLVSYLHFDVFVQAFPNEADLAIFLGLFVAATNLAELFIGAKVTPWLVRRFGVAQVNLIQPAGAVVTLMLLGFHYALVPAMLAWMNRKMLQDCLAAPVRSMLYGGIPDRFRGPVRANIDGVVGAGTQAVASLALGLVQQWLAVSTLVWISLGTACLYFSSAWMVRRVYVQSLVEDLAQGSLSFPVNPEPRGPDTSSSPIQQDLNLAGLTEDLRSSDLETAMAALTALGQSEDPLADALLARAFADPRGLLRLRAVKLLATRGENALHQVEPYLRAPSLPAVEAAYGVLSESESPLGRDLLGQELRVQVREAWRHLFLAEAAGKFGSPLLQWTLWDHSSRCQRLALKILSLLEGERLMGPVMNSLRFADSATRANAMEVLSNLGDRVAAGLLVLLIEPSTFDEKKSAATSLLPGLAEVGENWDTLVAHCLHSCAPYVRRAALAERQETPDPELERLYRLQGFELFAPLAADQLEEVVEHLMVERFSAGERVGHPGRLYLHLQGKTDPQITIFGLLPVLDQGPARVRVTALERATFWSLSGDGLNSIIHLYPSVGLAIFSRMARQLRLQEKLLKAQS